MRLLPAILLAVYATAWSGCATDRHSTTYERTTRIVKIDKSDERTKPDGTRENVLLSQTVAGMEKDGWHMEQPLNVEKVDGREVYIVVFSRSIP